MKQKRNLWKWFSGLVVTAGLTVFLAVPPQVAGPVGTAINDQAWSYFDDDEETSAQEQRAAEEGLLLDQGRETGPGESEETDPAVQLREEVRKQGREAIGKAAEAVILNRQVTPSLDKAE